VLTLSRLSDYAIVVVSRLAARGGGGQASARALAEETHIPLPTVIKVLKLLAAQGALASIQGRKGGYRLARPPTAISVIEIIEAVEGPIALTECNREASACRIEPTCGVHRHWLMINTAIRDALTHISVAELADPGVPLASWISVSVGGVPAAGPVLKSPITSTRG
jgi:FeS assembly SUF system regulator